VIDSMTLNFESHVVVIVVVVIIIQ